MVDLFNQKPLKITEYRSEILVFPYFREGLEETLTLHRLKIPRALRISFATTNPIESINAELDRRLKRLKKYCNSSQKHRWVAISLIERENHLGKVRNPTKISELQTAIQQEVLTLRIKK